MSAKGESKVAVVAAVVGNLLVAISKFVAAALTGSSAVEAVGEIRTMFVGPKELLVNLDVEFRPGVDAPGMHASIARIESALKAAYPEVGNVYIEAASLSRRD
jgi:divalent metal cation (Fe/Co/Zn/Cd) transporter